MNGKAALALLIRPAGGKSSGGGGDAVAEEEDSKETKGDADPKKLRLGAAKDILDADTAEDLDKALYEYVCAVMDQEDGENAKK